jgi:hypothetical protein
MFEKTDTMYRDKVGREKYMPKTVSKLQKYFFLCMQELESARMPQDWSKFVTGLYQVRTGTVYIYSRKKPRPGSNRRLLPLFIKII